MTNPEIQFKSYTDYALDMKLINQTDYHNINKLYPKCQQQINSCGNSFVPLSLFSMSLVLLIMINCTYISFKVI